MYQDCSWDGLCNAMCEIHTAVNYMHVSPVFSSQPHAPRCDILREQTMCQVFSTLRGTVKNTT